MVPQEEFLVKLVAHLVVTVQLVFPVKQVDRQDLLTRWVIQIRLVATQLSQAQLIFPIKQEAQSVAMVRSVLLVKLVAHRVVQEQLVFPAKQVDRQDLLTRWVIQIRQAATQGLPARWVITPCRHPRYPVPLVILVICALSHRDDLLTGYHREEAT
jgi:hypothetical protein